MTKEEILNTPEIVDFMIDKSVMVDSKMKLHKRLDELCRLAIKALEQEPCEDCISRKEALKLFDDRFIELQKVHQKDKQYGINWCINTLKDLPSVNPHKIGHWIKSNIGGAKVCSVCKAHMGLTNFKFCPNCGAKMVDPKESEE